MYGRPAGPDLTFSHYEIKNINSRYNWYFEKYYSKLISRTNIQ